MAKGKGIEFEERALIFLKYLFELLGFQVTEARRQKAGTQNGFDIKISFIDDEGKKRNFYFECKDYKSDISWDAISVKINQLAASSHLADGYIALSPHVNFSNININVLEDLVQKVQFPIVYWTPETYVQSYFSLDAAFYDSIYGKRSETSEEEKALIRKKIRDLIVDMLRQKDELAAKPEPITFPKELTLKLPRIDEDDIIGRADELQELNDLLFSHKKVVVVNGLGGIGKTTLAQGYLSKYYNDYQHIVWISQLTKDIVSDITSTERLAENLKISREGKETRQLFNEIFSQLKAIPGSPNLLILDNVDEELAKLKDYLPGQPNWHVLTTSRKHIEGFHAKELDFLSPEKAIALFKKHCTLITSDDQVADLVKVIDYHTLSIEILAKTAQRSRTDIEKLKNAIQNDLRSNVSIPHKGKGEKIDNVRSYLTSIFNVSSLTDNETWLMKQFTCLPTEYHPYERLLELIDPDETKKEVFAESCNSLVEQGWLLYNAKTDAYKIHRVVQEVVVRQLLPGVQDIVRLMDKIIRNLCIDKTKDNPVDKFKWIPFGNALVYYFPDDTSVKMAHLQNNLALVLQWLGDYSGARVLLEKALHSDKQNFGPDHPSTAISYSNLALVLKDLGYYTKAKMLLETALYSAQYNFGPDHPYTAVCYSNMAFVLKDLGDYSGARALLEKAMRSDEQHFGADHPTTAVSYSNLAVVLQNLGDYAEARELQEKALYITERNFGPDHPHTAASYSILGLILQYLGDYVGARVLLEKALLSTVQGFGPDHPTTTTRYSNLAGVLKDLGDYAGAKVLLEKALRSTEQHFGPDHPTTAIRYSNLALVLQSLGDLAGALELSQKSLSILRMALPENHPHILIAQRNYKVIKAGLKA